MIDSNSNQIDPSTNSPVTPQHHANTRYKYCIARLRSPNLPMLLQLRFPPADLRCCLLVDLGFINANKSLQPRVAKTKPTNKASRYMITDAVSTMSCMKPATLTTCRQDKRLNTSCHAYGLASLLFTVACLIALRCSQQISRTTSALFLTACKLMLLWGDHPLLRMASVAGDRMCL